MDGLRLSTSQGILDSGNTLSELKSKQLKSELTDNDGQSVKNFADSLKEAVQSVNTLQKDADVMSQKLATGETKNIPEVMLAVEKADIALKLMVQVRNKMIEAYQEIMRMQV
jgi:flagellar hook-basal body complex protein FliE